MDIFLGLLIFAGGTIVGAAAMFAWGAMSVADEVDAERFSHMKE
jgi:hypothetical protein